MFLIINIFSIVALPKAQAVGVRIGGQIEFTQNWKFDQNNVNWYIPPEIRRVSGEKISESTKSPSSLKVTKKRLKLRKRTKKRMSNATTAALKHSEAATPSIRMTKYYIQIHNSMSDGKSTDLGENTKKPTEHSSKKKKHKSGKALVLRNSTAVKENEATEALAKTQRLKQNNTEVRNNEDTAPTPSIAVKTTTHFWVTRFLDAVKPKIMGKNSIFKNAMLVKDDEKLTNFTDFVFKQSYAVFENIKSKINNTKLRSKVDYLAKSFRRRFQHFVDDTKKQKILTKLGNQKVVLNTIETSNRFMRRLLNYLIADLATKGHLRESGIENVLRNEMENELQQEYVVACQKFNICRAKKTFSGYLSELLTIILQVDDSQLKQVMDAMTETLKDSDLRLIMDKKLEKKFLYYIDLTERAEPSNIRPILWMFRNILANKNQPLAVSQNTDVKVVNQTVAIMDIIDILDQQIPANEENMFEWADLKNSALQWANKRRTDIQVIVDSIFWQTMKEVSNVMTNDLMQTIHDKLQVILNA